MKHFILLIILSVTIGSLKAQSYPSSQGDDVSYEYITNVQIGSINNTTTGSDADGDGVDGYDDFTTQTAVLIPGSTYSLSVTIHADTKEYINAWIDWNDDGDFTDAGESYVVVANTSSNGPHSVSITVPSSATGKNVRLRVSLKYNGAPASDEAHFNYGEVEDYSIYVDKDSDGDGIYDIADKDDDNDGMLDDDENICMTQDFTNGNFENNAVYPTTYIITDASNIYGWETTASDNKIEIWKSGFQTVPAYEGTYFSEINANMSARMYQTLNVEAGDIVRWNVAHRGRSGIDTMAIKVGPVGAPTTQQLAGTGTAAWKVYSSSYTVPAGVTQIEIGFESIYTASGNASIGNFIDDVQLYITRTTYCDSDGDGIPNILDLDSDNDGISDVVECGGSDPDNDGIIGTGAITDTDGDGVSDIVDTDNGGTALANADTDGDGLKNYMDIDSDGDGIVDNIEAQPTEGYVAIVGVDANSNGWDDVYEGSGNAIGSTDTDSDGTPDYIDTNSDNDGADDYTEAYDTDKDGVANTTRTNIDSDGDGLVDVFDNDGSSTTNSSGADNGKQTASSFPNDDNSTTSERDWREALSTLPVSLLSFDAELINNDYVELKWETASEINNDYFIVQRSVDNVNFEDIDKVAGNGNSNIVIEYSSYDFNVSDGIIYYRLKQVDYDGSTEYSNIRFVRKNASNDIVIYPNPSHGIFNIESSQPIEVIVSSISGQVIRRFSFDENSKNIIDLSNNPKGVYVLSILSNNETITKRIIVE